MTASNNAEKTRGKPFRPGSPGGPGRAAGSRNKATLALDAIGDEAAKEILGRLTESAKGGDIRAAEIILARVWPVRKGRPVTTLDIPPMVTPGDIVMALGAITNAMAAGEITPEEGASVASVLEVKRRSIETADLMARIEALEKGIR
jgi:hypothetical protein